MSMTEMVTALGRSMGELYRVVVSLARRGYLTRDADSDRYALSLPLFEMSHRHPPTDRLVKRALTILAAPAAETEPSCHLAVLHDDMALLPAPGPNPRPLASHSKPRAPSPPAPATRGSA